MNRFIMKMKVLRYCVIILFICHCKATTSESLTNSDSLRINTDLTATTNADSIDGKSSNNSNQFVQTQRSVNSTQEGSDAHICTREETYVEQIKVPSVQPVKIRSSTWCLEFPPRCSNYKTEMREVIKYQNVTKTRMIRFCCDGYERANSVSTGAGTLCRPVCRGGCGRGFCQTPDVCSCEAGYTGKHCTQRCDHDHWGLECKEECQCQNGAACDNKLGICHCTTGWTGEFCELPCPAGTYGVMCRKVCECKTVKTCHPQTGACEEIATSPVNVIETLNSTIVNFTNHLDRLAKNIVNIVPTTAEPAVQLLILPNGTTQQQPVGTVPEVIVINPDEQHTPKIILHQSSAGIGGHSKTPDVIHVITGWPESTNVSESSATLLNEKQLNLAGFGGPVGSGSNNSNQQAEQVPPSKNVSTSEHDTNLLTILLIILLIIMIIVAMSFLYVYRRYHWQKERVEAALAARNGVVGNGGSNTAIDLDHCESSLNKTNFLKPLPDLPGFTQMVRNKIEGQGYYDSPPSSISSMKTPSYTYARKESLYSVVTPSKSRKGSPDSHLYDEIRYHSQPEHQHHTQRTTYVAPAHQSHSQMQSYNHHSHQQQQQQQQLSQQSTHHVSHLIIPPQNSNFLQVPQLVTPHSSHSHKIAHL